MTLSKDIVIKSNKLIGMQSNLSLIQLKIFAKVIWSVVKKSDSEYYRFNIKNLLNDFYITDTNYTALKTATKDMIKSVVLQTANGEHQFALFTDVVYDRGTVDMYLHPKIKPLILDIEKRYTKYYFENIAKLNSRYSYLIYEFLKEYEFRKSRVFDLYDLKFLLNISHDKYPRYYDFKRYVLLHVQKELEEKTDIKFEFQEIREWRTVVKIEFKIINQNKETKKIINSSQNSLETLLKTKLFLNDTQIKTVFKHYEEEYIKRNIEYTLNQKWIKNISWYFIKALEQDFWQTLFIQKEQRIKSQNIADKKSEKEKQDRLQKIEQEKINKLKVEDFIKNREEEVIKLIPSFITSNKFLLQGYKIDWDNQDDVLEIIRGNNKELSNIRSLFIGFISQKII